MSELPKGWVEVKLPEFAELVMGQSPASSDCNDIGEGLPFFQGKAEFRKIYPEVRKFCTKPKKLAKKNDILLSVRAPVGPTNLASEECVIGRGLAAIRAFEQEENYLLHYFRAIEPWMSQQGTGSTFKAISGQFLKELKVNVAPLAEQKRIVEKLDEVLAQVDTIKARLDGIPDLLKRFRQSVLASAVSGKLTEEWRGEAHYKECLLGENWKWGAMPANWTAKFYPELVDSRLGKMLDKNKNVGKATKYLGNINVRWFDTDLSNVQEILVSDKEQEELALSKGDVLICEGGEPGRCCVWTKDSEEIIVFQKALHRARVKQEILSEWLVYNLKNDADSLILNQLFTGTTIKHLTGKALKSYPIRVPSIEEQKEIVRLVNQYFAFADTIEAQVKKAQARVDNLTQSILAKAFRGELVAQDPNDEPADKLLERIAEARADAEALTKAAKKAEAAKKRAAKKATENS